jgi:hypothetical protein
MNVEIWTEAAQFLFWKYINGIFVAVCLGLMVVSMQIRIPYPKHRDFLHLPRT